MPTAEPIRRTLPLHPHFGEFGMTDDNMYDFPGSPSVQLKEVRAIQRILVTYPSNELIINSFDHSRAKFTCFLDTWRHKEMVCCFSARGIANNIRHFIDEQENILPFGWTIDTSRLLPYDRSFSPTRVFMIGYDSRETFLLFEGIPLKLLSDKPKLYT